MKVWMKKIATTALFSAFAITAACGFAVQTKTVDAKADEASTALQTTLLSPTAYQHYLSLNAPSDAAANDGYIAIADGVTLYLYDRTERVYRAYTHQAKVTKLQFANDGALYFLDEASQFYRFTPQTMTAERIDGFACSTFLIANETLYFVSIAGDSAKLSKTELANPDVYATPLVSGLLSKPVVAFWQDELYYTDSGKYLHKIDPIEQTDTFVAAFQNELLSLQILDGIVYTADSAGNFNAYGLPDLSASHDASSIAAVSQDEGGYTALSVFGGNVFAVKNNAVREYDPLQTAFTENEITGASSSAHRIDNGTDVHFTDGKLYIAEQGNHRISIYDTQTQTYLPSIPLTMDAQWISSDGETALVCNTERAALYDVSGENYGAELAAYAAFDGNIIGIASVYGSYYLATDTNRYYRADSTVENYPLTNIKKTTTRYPKLLTADAYGNLYIASGKGVYRFHETEFLSATAEGEEVYTELPTQAQKLLVDYSGALYALCENTVQILTDTPTSYDFSTPLVYTPTANVRSFAFGIEENTAYLLYAENYIAQTTALQLPTVKTIAVNGVDKPIFEQEIGTMEMVSVRKDALLVEFDLAQLPGADVFAYLGYDRQKASLSAVKIGETERHCILSVYDEGARVYRTYLAVPTDCTLLSETEYKTIYPSETIGYVTNNVPLYKFPFLTPLLTSAQLSRNAQIRIVSEIRAPEQSYYQIAYDTEEGEKTGYVPTAYVRQFNGEPPIPETTVYGETDSRLDAVWRLTFLLLGAGAICILVDFLLLRNREDD